MHAWSEFEHKLRQHFFAEKNVPCESMETAAFKNFKLKSRQAILTDSSASVHAFLPLGHKVVFDKKTGQKALVTLFHVGLQHFVSDNRVPLKRSLGED